MLPPGPLVASYHQPYLGRERRLRKGSFQDVSDSRSLNVGRGLGDGNVRHYRRVRAPIRGHLKGAADGFGERREEVSRLGSEIKDSSLELPNIDHGVLECLPVHHQPGKLCQHLGGKP